MHPAFSVIFLTTLLGVGQGMFIALILVQWLNMAGLMQQQLSPEFYTYGVLVVLVFLGLALFASFFHLGHPERAFRTITQWRTSWLSREVIALPAFAAGAFAFGSIHYFGWDFSLFKTESFDFPFSLMVGLIGVALSIALWICTGMIYACIKFLQEWATPLTVINFILMGLASGFTMATLYAAYQAPELVSFFTITAIVFTLIAAIMRLSALIRNARIRPKSTPKTAIGVRHSVINQKAQGAMGGSYNTREYFHGKGDRFMLIIKWGFIILAFLVPLLLLAMGMFRQALVIFAAAMVIQYLGLLAERWFFFAQANHPQNIYYQGR